MNFASDNVMGVSPEILDALARANEGSEVSYGSDRWTKRAEMRLSELFECEIAMFLVATGTGANALSLAAMTPPFGSVICHRESHIMIDECGAPELFTGGAKLIAVDGAGGKMSASSVEEALAAFGRPPHSVKPAAISITQASEYGTTYKVSEIEAIAEVGRRHGCRLHMDGARFANAVVSLQARPADITWRAGVDVLSFGFTKNGALGAEAVILFDTGLAVDFPYLRKRTGHLWSKGRFLGAQVDAMLDQDLWMRNATHANAMAKRLHEGLSLCKGVRFPVAVEANELFPILPRPLHEALLAQGANFYEWSPGGVAPADRPKAGEVMARMVTSFATRQEDVESFIKLAQDLSTAKAA
ncbi:threonine aldolase [Rhodoligotrophos appendicifer]|uniref:threonine aldolase family protein n=1 Tax=Rhodoligotrophos appendicifer TaxID=987056 RepID=UPI0011853E32|nr:low specificity L-threonine aldolase [Rhodoligotrophos appendicifer]